MSAMSSLAIDVKWQDWQVSAGGALWTRRLESGELAAIWRYSDATGDYYKLLTDVDRGDYSALVDAMVAALLIESSRVVVDSGRVS